MMLWCLVTAATVV